MSISIFGQPSWEADCLDQWGRILEGGHAHWCKDWDYLPIDDTCEEFATCTCQVPE